MLKDHIFTAVSLTHTCASFSHYLSLLQAVFFPLYIVYSRLLYSTYTSHSRSQHVQAAPSVLSIQLNSNINDKRRSVALNISEAHLSHHTYLLCINSAFTLAVIHARICARVYRIRVDRSLQPLHHPPTPHPSPAKPRVCHLLSLHC